MNTWIRKIDPETRWLIAADVVVWLGVFFWLRGAGVPGLYPVIFANCAAIGINLFATMLVLVRR